MATVVAAWTRVIVEYAKQRGVDTAAMLARHGLDEEMLATRVVARVDDELWNDVDHALGDSTSA